MCFNPVKYNIVRVSWTPIFSTTHGQDKELYLGVTFTDLGCSEMLKKMTYVSLILSFIEYGATVCDIYQNTTSSRSSRLIGACRTPR